MNRLAEEIREARIKAGLSKKQLAKKCGLSETYIKSIESGKKIINENNSEKIFKVLGRKSVELINENEERVEERPEKRKKEKIIKENINVQPNDKWLDALSGVIKNYPVYDGQFKKVVDNRDITILKKKIDGHSHEKIFFMEAPSSDMESRCISKSDTLTLFKTKTITGGKIYTLKYKGTVIIGVLKVSNGNISIFNDKYKEFIVKEKEIEIIGECLKVEKKL